MFSWHWAHSCLLVHALRSALDWTTLSGPLTRCNCIQLYIICIWATVTLQKSTQTASIIHNIAKQHRLPTNRRQQHTTTTEAIFTVDTKHGGNTTALHSSWRQGATSTAGAQRWLVNSKRKQNASANDTLMSRIIEQHTQQATAKARRSRHHC
jgi:hypothetical protein